MASPRYQEKKEIKKKNQQVVRVLTLESILISIWAVKLQQLQFLGLVGIAQIPLVQWATEVLEICSPGMVKGPAGPQKCLNLKQIYGSRSAYG